MRTVHIDLGRYGVALTVGTKSRLLRQDREPSSSARREELAALQRHLEEAYAASTTLEIESLQLMVQDLGTTTLSRRTVRRSMMSGRLAVTVDEGEYLHATYDVLPPTERLVDVTLSAFEGEWKERFLRLFHQQYQSGQQPGGPSSYAADVNGIYDVTITTFALEAATEASSPSTAEQQTPWFEVLTSSVPIVQVTPPSREDGAVSPAEANAQEAATPSGSLPAGAITGTALAAALEAN